MARIAGVNIPTQKRVEIGLRYIHGIGPHIAHKIITQLGIDPSRRVSDLTESEVIQIREIIDRDYLVEGDLRFEPIDALTDHEDGLADLRAIVAGAPQRLVPQGWLLMEHGYDQGYATRHLLTSAGFAEVFTARDLGGNERCSGGRLPG